ncbi:Trm112 family protein [Candidatus Micrarchaeota archaeon]|nr:Trm112 family protein [Candidatus Micrarchaeota archaeon]MBU2475907.1 Trm112 family protein [Candidatus Micrarchaeota archaeon]
MNSNELSKELLDVLACPACSSDLNYNKKNSKLICTKCRKEFKIENGIPNMLMDD